MNYDDIVHILGDRAEYLLNHQCQKISKESLHLPGGDFVDRVFSHSDRNHRVLRNLQWLFSSGRLDGTGYLSILPVDQDIEHTAGFSFAPNPIYLDPENIVKLAWEAGCSAVASTLGILGIVSQKYAHKIPFIVKINHNELVTYPNKHDQILFASVKQAWNMGAVGVGATIYFGSKESNRQLVEVSQAFQEAHQLGMFTVLWCYVCNSAFEKGNTNYEEAADITSQANHLGATIEADIVKQKLPTSNKGFEVIKFGKYSQEMYDKLVTDHPIDLVRYQVANGYMGRIGLISSGGASGDNDFYESIKTAVINKRGGGMGLILGRKAFQKPMNEGVQLLNAVQDVYREPRITIA
ncbi:MAG: class I fructose-bisphosphate aldolase [Patescibacteria group bacterium]|jgi:class I fructose-bisphosphate aldolase